MDRRAHAAHGTTPAMRVAADDSQTEVDACLYAQGCADNKCLPIALERQFQ
jgi:hypothetical protein